MTKHISIKNSQINIADLGRLALRFFNDKDGLPQITVWCMVFDKKGYFWVGTEDGAAYYNGRKWKVVNMPNRTLGNFVQAMVAAEDGSIFFATTSGLYQLKDGKWASYNIESGLPNNSVHSLLETRNVDGSATLWIGTAEGGLAKLQNGRLTIVNTRSILPNFNIQCLLEVRANNGANTLWVGLDGGGLASMQNGHWTLFDTSSGFPNNRVLSLLETRAANGSSILWVGTYGGGLAKLHNGQWTTFDTESGLPSNYTRCLLESRDDDGTSNIWVCTYGGGLARLRNDRWTTFDTRSGFPCNDVRGIIEKRADDGTSTLWISIDGNGVGRWRNDLWTSFNTQTGLPSNIIYSFLETSAIDGNSIYWIGTYSGGLAKLENGQWTIFDTNSGLPNNTVYCLLETQDANGERAIWAGTEDGLARLYNGQWTIFDTNSGLPDNCIKCLMESRAVDGGKILWVGTRSGGLAKLHNNRWTIFDTRSGLPNNLVQCLVETRAADGSGIIWAGTRGGGLAKLENGRWKIFDAKCDFPNCYIDGLLETDNGDGTRTLWIGTWGGVVLFDLNSKKPRWDTLSDSTTPALPNNTVYQIRKDDRHRIYLFTNKGVARLTRRTPTPDDPAKFSIYTFTSEEGMPSSECDAGASMVDSQGRIWVGTIAGAAIFDPAREAPDRIAKPLLLERAEQLNGSALQQQISLAHNENNLIFEYSLLSFMRESDTRYKIQLEGFDKKPSDWTTQYRKEYTNLFQGNYTFKVWGRDYRGNISGPVEFGFSICSAPWRSWWAYMLYFGALASVGIGGVKLRMRVLEQHNQLLEDKINERTAELARALAEVKLSQKVTEQKNQELLELQLRADRIFSALAQALPGTVLDGKYRLDEKIGAGGFGVVYRGTHLAMKRSIAVKVFKPMPGNDSAKNLERFQQEAVSACRINHLNAVSVLDSGISREGIAYLVMELLEGYPLTKEMKQRGALSLRRCAEIMLPICEVLAKAHASGIIHRDIKPDNIFLHKSEEGEIVKVVDFGIAKLIEDNESLEWQNLTGTGGIVGTPVYMSPERLVGKPYDGKSDVYSLGVLLYEMLSGRVPFSIKDGGLSGLFLYHLTQTPPPLRKINPNVSEAMESVVQRSLEKDPALRPTAKELAQDIATAIGIDIEINNTGSFNFKLNDELIKDSATVSFDPQPKHTNRFGDSEGDKETVDNSYTNETVVKPAIE